MARCTHIDIGRGLLTLAALAVLLAAAGCGSGRYQVSGRVSYEDGTPVPDLNVIGQMGEGVESVTVQGTARSDGTFSWGTEKPGDGAKPGKYLVAVIPRGLGDAELAQGMLPAVDPKFSNPQTSGIEFDVKPGKNELNITLPKPKGPRRQ
jgi:hypothetical protein